MVNKKIVVVVLGLLVGLITQTVCAQAPEPENDVPVKVSFQVVGGPSYSDDIQPIFDEYCVTCHGSIVAENGLRLDDYNHLMEGTRYGSVIMPGKSSFSTLAYVLDGTASEEISMPHAGTQLSQNRLINIKYWIDAGAKDN